MPVNTHCDPTSLISIMLDLLFYDIIFFTYYIVIIFLSIILFTHYKTPRRIAKAIISPIVQIRKMKHSGNSIEVIEQLRGGFPTANTMLFFSFITLKGQ